MNTTTFTMAAPGGATLGERAPTLVLALESLALEHCALGFARDALALLVSLTRLCPESVAYWTWRGRLHGEVGEVVAALGALQRAVSLGPQDRYALILLGEACLEAGQHDRGARVLRQAVELGREPAAAFSEQDALTQRAMAALARLPLPLHGTARADLMG